MTDQAVSTFASTFGTFAISWIVYDITGSKIAMGSLWLVTFFAQMVIRFLAGPFIDQWSKVSMMRLSESIRLLSYLCLFVLSLNGHVTFTFLYIAAFLSSIVVYDTAASALLPTMIKKENLVKSNAKISGINQLMRLITLPVAGLLIGLIGQKGSLLLITLLFFLSLCILRELKEPVDKARKIQKWKSQFKSGITIYMKHKILLKLGLFIATTSFGVSATQAMYIPYVSDILGGSSFIYGLFTAAFPLGYIIGSFIVGKLEEPKKYLYVFMVGALFAGGITYICLGFTRTTWIAISIETIGGMVMPFWNVYSTTLYQRIVPETLLGQVFSMRFLLTKAANPIGILYGTFCATTFSLPIMFLTVGIIICVVTGIGVVFMSSESSKDLEQYSV
jgi:Na+/melibiose symporter-like transporter